MKSGDGVETGGHATIEQAYDELTKPGFAVWMRLMVTPRHHLSSGRERLATLMGYSRGRFDYILKELYNKGYIGLEKNAMVGKPTSIVLARRAILAGRSHFIRLSNHLLADPDFEQIASPEVHQASQEDHNRHPQPIIYLDHFPEVVTDMQQSRERSDMGACNLPGQFAVLDPTCMCGSAPHIAPSGLLSLRNHTPEKVAGVAQFFGNFQKLDKENTQSLRSKMLAKGRIKYGSDTVVASQRSKTETGAKNGVPYREYTSSEIKEQAKDVTHNGEGHSKQESTKEDEPKAKRTELSERLAQKHAAVKAARTKARNDKKKLPQKPMEWEQLDLRGHPSISFEPRSKERAAIMEILDRKPKDKRRQAVMKKLISEMGRIYTRFRIMLQKSKNHEPTFKLSPKLRDRYCGLIAVECLYNEITPRQLLEYWQEHVTDFADKDMKYPSLSFLAAPYAAEKVANALFEDTQGGQKKWKPGNFKRHKDDAHSFSDTGSLDKRLRRGLVEAGFDVRACDDRYLMTIQQTAKTIAAGHKLFVSEPIRAMVKWAVTHLYGGGK